MLHSLLSQVQMFQLCYSLSADAIFLIVKNYHNWFAWRHVLSENDFAFVTGRTIVVDLANNAIRMSLTNLFIGLH